MFAPTNSDGADPGLQRVFFSPATNFAAGDLPHSLTIGDFNGDGKRIWRYQMLNSDNHWTNLALPSEPHLASDRKRPR